MRFGRSIALLAFAALLAASCRSLTPPPGFVSGGGTAGRIEFPSSMPPEAQYALLSWYDETYSGEARRQAAEILGIVRNAKNDCAMQLRGMAVSDLVEKYPGFAFRTTDGGIAFRCESLGVCGDLAAARQMLDVCLARLHAPQKIGIPAERCEQFLAQNGASDEVPNFRSWSAARKTLPLTFADDPLKRLLEECRTEVSEKAQVLEALTHARAALDDPNAEISRLPDEIGAALRLVAPRKALETIGDWQTIPEVREFAAELPALLMETALKRIAGEEDLERGEERLTRALESWKKDPRFASARKEVAPQLQETVTTLCRKRLDSLRQAASSAQENHAFREWMLSARARLAELSSGTLEAWGCYAECGMLPTLVEALKAHDRELSAAAREFYLRAQTDALATGGRPAVAIVFGDILEELFGAEELPAARDNSEKARALLEARPPLFRVAVDEFRTPETGVGRTWSRDLAAELATLSGQWHADRLLTTAPAAESRFLCTLADVRLTQFSGGDENLILRDTKKYPWHGAVQLRRSADGEIGFVQPLWEITVSTENYLRLGKVSLEGSLRCSDRCRYDDEIVREIPFVLNATYRREFVRESASDPQLLSEKLFRDEREQFPEEAPPVLRVDRLWSASEMMDYARQRALEECAEKVLSALLEFAAQETSNADPTTENSRLDLLEVRGELLFALQKIDLANGTELAQEIARLREALPKELRAQADKALRKP